MNREKLQGDTSFISLGKAALLTLIAIAALFEADIVAAAGDKTFQPSDPCVVLACPRPEATTEITYGNSLSSTQKSVPQGGSQKNVAENEGNGRSSASAGISAPPLLGAISEADKVVVDDVKEMQRVLACSKAFKKFSKDGNGGGLVWGQSQDYFAKCFRKADELPAKLKAALLSTIVAIQTQEGAALCTGSLLTNRLVLTARHCLLKEEEFGQDPKRPLNPSALSRLIIKGIGGSGEVWERKASKVVVDPFDASSPFQLSAAYDVRKTKYPRTLDLVVVQVDVPLEQVTGPVPLATASRLSSLRGKQRLLLGFFRQDEKAAPPRLYIDDLASCLIREVDRELGYLHHHCQTYASVSGAAIFLYEDEGVVNRIAIHVAPAGVTLPEKKNLITGNEGILVPAVLSTIQ